MPVLLKTGSPLNPYEAPPALLDAADIIEPSQTGQLEESRRSEAPAEAAALGASLGAIAGWAILSFYDWGPWLFGRGAIAAGISVALAVFFIHRRQGRRGSHDDY